MKWRDKEPKGPIGELDELAKSLQRNCITCLLGFCLIGWPSATLKLCGAKTRAGAPAHWGPAAHAPTEARGALLGARLDVKVSVRQNGTFGQKLQARNASFSRGKF